LKNKHIGSGGKRSEVENLPVPGLSSGTGRRQAGEGVGILTANNAKSAKKNHLLVRIELMMNRPKLPPEFDASNLPDPAEMLRQAREERDFQLLMALGDDLLRPIASQHGLNWDEMHEEEREQFIRKIVRE
jgi:hypothetical protein